LPLSVATPVVNNAAANNKTWSFLVCIENCINAQHYRNLAENYTDGTDKIRDELSRAHQFTFP
jgi:hypothetical protein